eukprot:764586-Hanusia_phi.AAC.1
MQKMKVGDLCFYYHSSCKVPGIVGLAKVASTARVDPTALDPKHKYYDPKSDPEKPRWFGVDLQFVRDFKRMVTLTELKTYRSRRQAELARMDLFNKPRLSVQAVSKEEWEHILRLEDKETPDVAK